MLFLGVIIPLLVLWAIYGLVILGLVVAFRKAHVPSEKAIFFSFLAFGAALGFFTAWLWPADSSVYFNVFGVLLGDPVYDLSIRYFGDIISPQAHYTIPWVLRIPQVYVITSIVVYALIGLLLQLVTNRCLKIKDGDKMPLSSTH
jgi:hypothetical protein